MRPEMVTKAPPKRPDDLETDPKAPIVNKTPTDKTVTKQVEPETKPEEKPGYFSRLKKGLGSMVRNYLDSDK